VGVSIEEAPGALIVRGNTLVPSPEQLDAGNSGTTMRLLTGILAGQPFASEITGDASLRARPMDRIIEPLRQMGADIAAVESDRYPPLRIHGRRLRGIAYTLPVASAQVKSAILLATLFAEGPTTVMEPLPTRDHTERILSYFGAEISRQGTVIKLAPGRLTARDILVPGDLSAAAFVLAAAAALPGSEVIVEGVGLNPTRTGLLEILQAMGAIVEIHSTGEVNNEPMGTITVRGRQLHGVTIGGAMIPRVIDELPVLSVVATVADGATVITDAAELRIKESDRIGTIAQGLRALRGEVKERSDGLTIYGSPLRGGRVHSAGDHRVAMAFAIAGLLARAPVTVEGAESMAISFPEFTRAVEAVTPR
jgi:3-phosphoshikimate 1-carboxyvinyltransferase